MEVKAIVLAAGKGTRMKSELPKVLHKVNGIPMLKKVMNTLEKSGVSENIVVLGHKIEVVLKELGEIQFVEQKEQLGTAHAVMQAEEKLKDFDGIVLVLCGDTPLITEKTIDEIIKLHTIKKSACTVLTAEFKNPFGYGRIVKNSEDIVEAIIEEKDADEKVRAVMEVNAGVYCFDNKKLFSALKRVKNNNAKNEFYLTDVIKLLRDDNEKVYSYKLEDHLEILGINSRIQLAEAAKVLRQRKNNELMDSGVTLIDPEFTYVEENVIIGTDTVIFPGVFITGDTRIGNNVQIIGNSRIEDSVIEDNVVIDTSVVEESIIRNGATLGPFAHIRPKADIGEKVHVGNFVEIKKAVLHKGVKAGHLTYIGDAEIGENTNVGAGTITCNYDGKNKFKTTIGKNVFVGSDTKFVAPVEIGDNSLIAAGSVITENVPVDSLAIARARQTNKDGWRNNNKK